MRPAIETRQFQSAIDSFGPAIGKKYPIHAGPCRKFARQRPLVGIVKKIGKMDGPCGFAANHLNDARMRVPEPVYGNATQKIQIFFPGGIVNIGAAAVGEHNGWAFVGRQQKFISIQQALIDFRAQNRSRAFARGLSNDPWRFFYFPNLAAEIAACAAESGSRNTRVPGIVGTTSSGASLACAASSNASGAVPPTMRTSRT